MLLFQTIRRSTPWPFSSCRVSQQVTSGAHKYGSNYKRLIMCAGSSGTCSVRVYVIVLRLETLQSEMFCRCGQGWQRLPHPPAHEVAPSAARWSPGPPGKKPPCSPRAGVKRLACRRRGRTHPAPASRLGDSGCRRSGSFPLPPCGAPLGRRPHPLGQAAAPAAPESAWQTGRDVVGVSHPLWAPVPFTSLRLPLPLPLPGY